ncbi:hypothetical protein ALC57_14445 [Trachymyrmex cornetzi]|uniref:Uncharacterized protein n=1 Tax=Trachymyrmex cornetzi TaxID=471704 RepID=A0A195DKR5_9HYME|nr:hypothetical protein ALC57_14445 [Trachymyrmex cornetzi]
MREVHRYTGDLQQRGRRVKTEEEKTAAGALRRSFSIAPAANLILRVKIHDEDLWAMPVIVNVWCHLPGDSDLLTGDDLAARWLVVDCAALSRLTVDILALILATRPPGRPAVPVILTHVPGSSVRRTS